MSIINLRIFVARKFHLYSPHFHNPWTWISDKRPENDKKSSCSVNSVNIFSSLTTLRRKLFHLKNSEVPPLKLSKLFALNNYTIIIKYVDCQVILYWFGEWLTLKLETINLFSCKKILLILTLLFYMNYMNRKSAFSNIIYNYDI